MRLKAAISEARDLHIRLISLRAQRDRLKRRLEALQ